MTFRVQILGSNSAIPTPERNPSAQLLNFNENFFLIDCAEGTQLQLRKFRAKFQRINHIFISHLHGDHYLGLLGLIFTYHLLDRRKELHIYSNPDLFDIIDATLRVGNTTLGYPLIAHPLKTGLSELIFDNGKLEVQTVPLNHRIPTWGFVFREKNVPLKIRKDMLGRYKIPFQEISLIKNGLDYVMPNGDIIKNEDLTFPSHEPASYAYISDTIYDESILPYITNVDLLYHETTFLSDMAKQAHEKFHTTAPEAALIAKKAKAGKLLMGHFSARYDDLTLFLEEARTVFENSHLTADGDIIELR
jgi:ribonuclease Z